MAKTQSSLYEKSSMKQLLKKLKYAKEEYYSTLSPEAKKKLEHIKLKIVINSGKSKRCKKDVVNTKEKKEIEAKREKERRKKEKKRKKREKKIERNRIKQEEQKSKFKEAIEEMRRRKEREAKEEAERQAKEERERYKAREEYRRRKLEEDRKLPEDIYEFKKNPTKKVWRDLIKKYHPDKGGDLELMKIINNIWEEAAKEWRRRKVEEERKIPQDIFEFKKFPTKKVWRDLIKKYHPDKGGDLELMKIINKIWESI